jgi:hypothetical protein
MIATIAALATGAAWLIARTRAPDTGIPTLPLTPLVPPPDAEPERGTSHAPSFCPDLGTRKTLAAPFQDPITREISYFGEYSGTVTGCFDDATFGPVVCVGGGGGLRCARR